MENRYRKLQQFTNLSITRNVSLFEAIKLRFLFLLFISMVGSGCASYATLTGTIGVNSSSEKAYTCRNNHQIPRVYGGVFYDVSLLQNPDRPPLAPIVLVPDVLFSAIFDTVMLVVTVPGQLAWGNLCPSEEDGRINNT
jgi:uncharacterized protein YceK